MNDATIKQLASIAQAAKALAKCAELNGVAPEECAPMVIALANKEIAEKEVQPYLDALKRP